MTVSELIEALSQLPGGLPVVIEGDEMTGICWAAHPEVTAVAQERHMLSGTLRRQCRRTDSAAANMHHGTPVAVVYIDAGDPVTLEVQS